MRTFKPLTYVTFALLLLFASNAWANVNHVTGDYSETNVDISVQALGGPIYINRYYFQGKTGFNRSWEPLEFGPPDNLGLTRSIKHKGAVYINLDSLPNSYIFDEKQRILRTADGYTWVNHS